MGYFRGSAIGNLGSDPELRYTQKGTALVSFRMAVNDRRRGQDGEYTETTEWVKVTVTGSKADYAQRFLKGNRVLVDGRVSFEHWTNRDGVAQTTVAIWADELTNLTPRTEQAEGDDEGYAPAPAAAGRPTSQRAAAPADTSDLEDLPF